MSGAGAGAGPASRPRPPSRKATPHAASLPNAPHTPPFQERFSSYWLWYRFLRVKRQIKRSFCLYVGLFYPQELTSSILHYEFINLPTKQALWLHLTRYFLGADGHVSLALQGHSPDTWLDHHFPCASIQHLLGPCMLCSSFCTSPLDQCRPNLHKNLVSYFVYVSETGLSLRPFLFWCSGKDVDIFSPTVISQTNNNNNKKGTNQYLELICNGIASSLTRHLAAGPMGDNWACSGGNGELFEQATFFWIVSREGVNYKPSWDWTILAVPGIFIEAS